MYHDSDFKSKKVENKLVGFPTAATEAQNAIDNNKNITEGANESAEDDYSMSWRTIVAVLSLSAIWSALSYAISGPNFAIKYMIADYPQDSGKATWIANAPLFFVITLPPITGAGSDRYGKKWFMIGGAVLGIIGALVSGEANNVNTIIGGQAISGCGGTFAAVTIAAGLEVVPAKTRPFVIAIMATINAALGTIGGQLVFATCVQQGLGWRWGFRIQAIIYTFALVLVFLFYHPPPTRLRRRLSTASLLKSIDYIGIALLAIGSAALTVALVWGGAFYPWGSTHVVPLLVIAPLFYIAFGFYEWRARNDGIMHHDFFSSRSFPIFILFGFFNGMLLYGTSVFIPNQTRALYTDVPLEVATPYAIFSTCLLPGFIFFGYISLKTKQFRWPLVACSLFLTLFCGLTARTTPSSDSYYKGMLAVLGFLTSATEILPVAGISLIVPSHLIATSNTVLGTFRGIGGILSIAIFTTVYNTQAAKHMTREVIPILTQLGVPSSAFATIIGIVTQAPSMLSQLPNMTPELEVIILQATKIGAAQAYQYVWYCIMASSAICLLLSCLIVDSPEAMTNLVESTLELGGSEDKQQRGAQA